jgi:hypothetical protein
MCFENLKFKFLGNIVGLYWYVNTPVIIDET